MSQLQIENPQPLIHIIYGCTSRIQTLQNLQNQAVVSQWNKSVIEESTIMILNK
jgi:hypothetical protein